MRAAVVVAAAVGLSGCGGNEAAGPSTSGHLAQARPPGPEHLTPEQLSGQHVVVSFDGRRPPAEVVRLIRRGEAAGVVLFERNLGTPGEVRALTRALQAIPRPAGLRAPLLVMVDQEGGTVKRLPGAPGRSPREMAATGDPAVARAEGAATARTLRSAGVNVDLAPVVDVARPGSALAREGRAFGATTAVAARYGAAFIRGLRAGGVAGAAKHFPGFGAATLNTDDGQTVIRASRAELARVDEPPFRAAIAAGAPMVMVASAIYPALSGVPAVLSPSVVQRELRDGLGFDGVTISDDLETPALLPYGGASAAAVRAAAAGVDLLLFAQSVRGARRAIGELTRRIRDGRLPRAGLEAGLRRVLALRASLGEDP